MNRPLVYVASPYTKGDPAMNTHFQCRVFDQLMDDKVVWPLAPLWTHFQHTVRPRRYADWVTYDEAILSRCDAVLRLDASLPELDYQVGESSGADAEVTFAQAQGIPVFYSIPELYAWAGQLTDTDA